MGHDERDRSTYNKVKDDFQQLELEERASFLVEATAATILEGARRASETLAREVDEWSKRKDRSATTEPPSPGPAEPESTNHAD